MASIKEVAERYHVSQDTLRYYERVGMIPPVTRTSGGIRDYGDEDLRWVELAICTRNAGMPVEAMIEYVRLFRMGDETIPARLSLLNEQMEVLRAQLANIEDTMERLAYKIDRYEQALRTGRLVWDDASPENGGRERRSQDNDGQSDPDESND
ncbi:transcriptional regulator [Bifidobacterium lemurum]|uniref:Transcriptional regulator n=1 Tax=Bifidobacterium lemurum TaxID=1603886 RepID=A0A261FUY0_9BIFI|nr:MerR family transcriptional regulator [Bifidobacterium lemurum]OZG62979.1 transcriptional regulator [Bifidobacterium lemurum]QOL33328.1 MerR family transcriptional regulator [Bifidobacterium lemurum]